MVASNGGPAFVTCIEVPGFVSGVETSLGEFKVIIYLTQHEVSVMFEA